jgi:hypothetical protein
VDLYIDSPIRLHGVLHSYKLYFFMDRIFRIVLLLAFVLVRKVKVKLSP